MKQFHDELPETPPPPMGDNLPDYDPKTIVDLETFSDRLRKTYAHLFARRDQLIAASQSWKALHPGGVKDDDDQGAATDQLAQIMDEISAFHGSPNSVHTLAKAPFLKGGRIVDDVLNADLTGKLREASEILSKPMKAYADAKVARLRREAAEEAQRTAEEAALAVAKSSKNTSSLRDLEAAMEAEQASIDAMAAAENTKASVLTMTRGDTGASSGLRGKWKVRVLHEDLVPSKYMVPSLALLETAMNISKDKKTGVPTAIIPGVEFYEETSFVLRK